MSGPCRFRPLGAWLLLSLGLVSLAHVGVELIQFLSESDRVGSLDRRLKKVTPSDGVDGDGDGDRQIPFTDNDDSARQLERDGQEIERQELEELREQQAPYVQEQDPDSKPVIVGEQPHQAPRTTKNFDVIVGTVVTGDGDVLDVKTTATDANKADETEEEVILIQPAQLEEYDEEQSKHPSHVQQQDRQENEGILIEPVQLEEYDEEQSKSYVQQQDPTAENVTVTEQPHQRPRENEDFSVIRGGVSIEQHSRNLWMMAPFNFVKEKLERALLVNKLQMGEGGDPKAEHQEVMTSVGAQKGGADQTTRKSPHVRRRRRVRRARRGTRE